MEKENNIDIFNGQEDPKKPKLTAQELSDVFRKPTKQKGSSMFSNNTLSPSVSHDTEGLFKFGNDNVFEANQRDDADAQSFSKQLALFTGNTILNIGSGTIGGIGYLGTIFEDSKGDYSNAITDWADSVRNPFGEIKRENNDVFDLTDTAFWFNSGQSIVESAVQFGLIAETGGLLAGGVAGKLGSLLKLGNTAMKTIKGGIQAMTSVELSYLEGAMSGASVYRDIYKNQYDKLLAKGLSIDEANEKAKEFASNGASSVVQLNTTIGSMLNLTGIGSVFNREANVAQRYFSEGLGKRLVKKDAQGNLINESIADYSARLVKQSPEFLNTLTKQNYGRLLSEMTQEGIEEVVTQLAENTGRAEGQSSKDVGYLDSFQSAYNNINSVLNSEGLLNFSLGAIGGLGQTVLLDKLIPSQRINKLTNDGQLILDTEKTAKAGKPIYQTQLVSPRTRDIYDNQIYHNTLKDALVSDMTAIDDIKKQLANTTDRVEKQELFRKLFNITSIDSVYKGTGENLIADYEEILKQDNTTDLSEQFKKPLEDITKQMDSNKALLNDANTSEEDKIKIKEEQIELSKQSVDLQKSITENKGKTQASKLGLSKDSKDNEYQLRATKAINQLKQLTEIHKKNKEKYNQPEETNVNFAEYITKLQGDIIGRRDIQADLERDFHKEKADFQMFSGIEEYAHIENILTNTELTSLYSERDRISEAVKEYKKSNDVKVLEALVDGLDNKVYSETELSEKLIKKVEDINNGITEKETDIEERIKNSESYKKSKFKTLDAYLKYYSSKNTAFQNLGSFNSTLLAYKRKTESMSKKLDEVSSNKGRSKFITNAEERIKLKKEQIEADHNIYSFEEAVQMSDEIYYNNKVEKLNEKELGRIKKEIENLEKEIKELEEDIVINKKKSFYNSFLEYFNKLSNKEMIVSLRKQRLNEIKEYLDSVQKVKEKAKQAVSATDSKAEKDNIVAEAGEVINPNTIPQPPSSQSDEDNASGIDNLFAGMTVPSDNKLNAQKEEVEKRRKEELANNKLSSSLAAMKLAEIAVSENIVLSELNREEYVNYAISKGIRISDQEIRYAPELRNPTSILETMKLRKSLRDSLTDETKKEWDSWSNSMIVLADKPQKERYLANQVRLTSYTAKSQSWIFFDINNSGLDSSKAPHKSYFSLKDFNRIKSSQFVSFMEFLQTNGYIGTIKTFQDLTNQGVILNDQFVMHGDTENDAKLGEKLAKEFFKDEIKSTGLGKDSFENGKAKSYSQILSDKIQAETTVDIINARYDAELKAIDNNQNVSQSNLINEIEKREKQIKSIIEKLNLFLVSLTGDSKTIVSDFIESSVYNKSFDANLLYKLLEQYYPNKIELNKLVLDLFDETNKLIQFDTSIQNSIDSQIAEIKKLIDDDYAIQLAQQQQGSPVSFNPDLAEESNDSAKEESEEEEYSIPFTLNMLRSQQGDTNVDGRITDDMTTNYDLIVDSEVSIRVVESKDKEKRVAFFLSGSNKLIGYLPTNEFMSKKDGYNKKKDEFGNYVDNTKFYWSQEATGISNIEHEVVEVIREMENFNFSRAEEDSVISFFKGEFGIDKEINYTNYNKLRIEKIRAMFDKNPNLDLKSKVTDKREGRIISDNVVKNLEISKNNDSRVRIHLNSQETLYPAVSNGSKKNVIGKSLAYISFPTTTGTSRTFPLILKKLQKEKINSIISLVNMYYEDKQGLQDIYNKLGFNNTYKSEGEKFSDLIFTYFTTINYDKSDNKGNSFTYFENGNEFVFGKTKINSLNLIRKNQSSFGANVVNRVTKVLQEKLFTLDKTILSKEFAYDKVFKYPVLENDKIVIKTAKDYYEYIEKNIQTYATINTENRDKNNKIIYVKNFVVNFDSGFYEREMNPKPQQSEQQEPDKNKGTDYGLGDILNDNEGNNNSDNSDNTFDDFDSDVPFSLSLERKPDYSFVEQYQNSSVPHEKFIGDVIFNNILNNSELKNKSDYLNQFKEITNLEDAVQLFHKICKQ